MSGGGNKKKTAQSQGWEEAGSEFYQESYPTDSEFDVLQRDPKRLATLLPSKQTRAAIATIKIRTNDYRTNRGRSYNESATVRRRTSTTAGDIQVAMMPDLSEMEINEKTAWEEVMQLKALPISMSEKKEMKSKILNEPNLRLQGYEHFKWKRHKMWDQVTWRLKEFFHNIELWKNALKHIEGNFGTGIVTFFLFIKWLFFLNFIIFLFILIFLVIPSIFLDPDMNKCNSTCCSDLYFNHTSTNNIFLDVIQGTGPVERTWIFYGTYSHCTLSYMVGGIKMYYNMPLAYILITIVYFLISLMAILKTAAGGFKERLVEGEGQFYQYCNLILGGWDFCINNERAAHMKHKALYGEIKATLETQKLKEERKNRTKKEKYKIYICRVIVNLTVLSILACAGFAIFIIFRISTEQIQNLTSDSKSFEQFFYEFLPSITIVALNVIVPLIFKYLINFEKYSPTIQLRFFLIRTVFLRLASLIVFYVSLLDKVNKMNNDECIRCDITPVCWETFVGQQILKLLLTDFGTHIFLTFIFNFPRSLLAKHINSKFFKLIGEQTFDLPKHALDVVYIQTLCWFGTFYAPFLSLLTFIIFFLLFYVKKFSCLINSKPSPVLYHASRSNSMFMLVLLVSYSFAIFPIAYSISEIAPSKSCGPFRQRESVWSLIVDLFMMTPYWLQNIVFFLSTAGFAIPCFIILLFLLYYYTAVSSANRHMVSVLKNQLVLEGHDKQFLLDRLSLFIRQENQKRLTTMDGQG